MDELTKLSAKRLAALVRGREVSPVEIVEAYLRRIERLNPQLNAVVTLAPDAVDCAREAEEAMMHRREVGVLHGVPITVKDTIETKGVRTTSGSMLRARHIPDEDAPAVARLKSAGAIILGKTNVPEMAIPYECDNPVFGRTNNPHDASRTSGGSSGGEAAAISARLSPAGLGSDLSGSIRVPAHFCGIFGLKPTLSRVSTVGHFPPANSAFALGATVGPMARHVEDLSLLLEVLIETESVSSTSAGKSSHETRLNVRGSRVAAFLDEETPVTKETRRAMEAAMRALGEAGCVIVEEKPPGLERAIALWPALFARESALQLRGVYAGREDEAGEIVRAVLTSADDARRFSPDDFIDAQAKRDSLRAALVEWMKQTPLIIAPVGAVSAFAHGARRVEVEGRELSVFRAFGYARAANVLGLPAVSVPAGRSPEGLPLGIQIIGRPFQEEEVLAAASVIEQSLGGSAQPPSAIE